MSYIPNSFPRATSRGLPTEQPGGVPLPVNGQRRGPIRSEVFTHTIINASGIITSTSIANATNERPYTLVKTLADGFPYEPQLEYPNWPSYAGLLAPESPLDALVNFSMLVQAAASTPKHPASDPPASRVAHPHGPAPGPRVNSAQNRVGITLPTLHDTLASYALASYALARGVKEKGTPFLCSPEPATSFPLLERELSVKQKRQLAAYPQQWQVTSRPASCFRSVMTSPSPSPSPLSMPPTGRRPGASYAFSSIPSDNSNMRQLVPPAGPSGSRVTGPVAPMAGTPNGAGPSHTQPTRTPAPESSSAARKRSREEVDRGLPDLESNCPLNATLKPPPPKRRKRSEVAMDGAQQRLREGQTQLRAGVEVRRQSADYQTAEGELHASRFKDCRRCG
ncbi:hypothetical protein BC834DRAFT_846853 [Gloeopeniophorella convolvens]|nr:hypothetical protein BC834DRAFT_846853 [Gloeopeniophorella convolvens]